MNASDPLDDPYVYRVDIESRPGAWNRKYDSVREAFEAAVRLCRRYGRVFVRKNDGETLGSVMTAGDGTAYRGE